MIFISLMEGSPWGGSEELWYRVAKFSLENQNIVLVNIKHWDLRHHKIEELRILGAKITERKNRGENKLLFRILLKIRIKIFGPVKSKDWLWLENETSNHIIISLGGPHDFLSHPELFQILQNNKFNYSVIQQFNFENITYNEYDRRIVKLFYSKAINSYFVSKRNLEVTERSICMKLENASIISNPANLSEMELIPFPQQMDQINFACVARLDCMFKAQDILLSVLGKDKWIKRDWKLNFYGEGKDLEYLKELVDFYRLNSRVTFHGHVKNVDNIWVDNHILILPSLAEGTPLSLIEAMVCGRPAIVTDVGGNSELIEDSFNGYIIPASNVKQCDLTIEKAWQERNKWQGMGIEARNQVLTKINFNSYKDIYNNAVK
ncbi:MAG: glycosyltransferase family 4 protein [Bacteroidetes bacterium]|nr:glycosyltransferase family 4 protein [Bacteroidota bacterium]